MKKKCDIIIKKASSETHYQLRNGLRLDALNAKNETALEFDCREANCGICIVKVLEGEENLSYALSAEKGFLKAMSADPEERLACQCRVFGDIKIEVEDF